MKKFLIGAITGSLVVTILSTYFRSNEVKNVKSEFGANDSVILSVKEFDQLKGDSKQLSLLKEKTPDLVLALLASIGIKLAWQTQNDLKSYLLSSDPKNIDVRSLSKEILDQNQVLSKSASSENSPKNFDPIGVVEDSVNRETLPQETKPSEKMPNSMIKNRERFFNSQTISEFKIIKRVNGVYKGLMNYFRVTKDGEEIKKLNEVFLSIDFFQTDEGKLNGKFLLNITGDGTDSRNRGEGGNRQIKLDDKGVIYLEASPNSFFTIEDGLQSMNKAKFKAIYYQDFEKRGTVLFEKE
jgi:hypothetical protein